MSSGGIVRIEHDREKPYVMVSKALTEDKRLSFALRGVLVYLLGKRNDWTTYMAEVENSGAEGREAMKAIFAEGRRYGYIRTIEHREKGRISYEHIIYESPLAEPVPEILTPDGQPSSVLKRQQKAAANAGKPSTKKPSTGSRQREAVNGTPSTETRRVISNEELKNENQEKPSRADAQGGQARGNDQQSGNAGGLTRDVAPQAAQGTPDGVAADAATLSPDHTSQTPQSPARSETEAATTEKGSAGAAAPATEHQAMMTAIREAVYPGTPRCADKIEQRLAAASKQLRSAGLGVDAPAAIVAHIRARHAWRKYLTPEHVVEHSAEWASLHTKPAATSEAAAPAVVQKGFLR
ncbi:hypothetical protein [Deinococcus kurensis]|uniref:hypothetical protein n=1 Tax=Deinococcus kurensis TaxID=2662757 RepID=UPI0012D2A157|nr:hypothetical protein [Deinococcus kurensis]